MTRWDALVLAAGRGPDDPMARAWGVSHKCAIPVGGVPMLARVVTALQASPRIGRIAVSIESSSVIAAILGPTSETLGFIRSAQNAPASALAAIESGAVGFPLLVTTADHALLEPGMVMRMIDETERSGADLGVGLARDSTILGAYPEARRTYLAFGADRVSGCNLFALRTAAAVKALERWRGLDAARKRPWRIVRAFGPASLLRYAAGRLSLERAFAVASARLGLDARPILLPLAEAAIDIDKPADKNLAERILARRGRA